MGMLGRKFYDCVRDLSAHKRPIRFFGLQFLLLTLDPRGNGDIKNFYQIKPLSKPTSSLRYEVYLNAQIERYRV